MIRESQRPLLKEIPKPKKRSKHGKEGKQDYIENPADKAKEATAQRDLKTLYTMPKGNRKRVHWRVTNKKAEFYSA